MSQALQTISNEHRSMWQVSVVLEELCKQCADPEHRPDAELFEQILNYIEQYIERVHQPKEETYLYRAVSERTDEGRIALRCARWRERLARRSSPTGTRRRDQGNASASSVRPLPSTFRSTTARSASNLSS